MMKKLTFLIIILVGTFVIPNISLAKINSMKFKRQFWRNKQSRTTPRRIFTHGNYL